MAEENFKQNTPPQNLPVGPSEGEMPLMKQDEPKIDLRTMSSDVSSMKESGGSAPRPYTPPPPVFPKPQESKPVFTPPQVEPTEGAEKIIFAEEKPKTKGKATFVVALTIIVVIALGAVGYFFIYPKLFSGKVISEPVTPETITETPQPQVPTVPVVEAPTPQNPSIEHFSLFKIGPDSTIEKEIGSLGLQNLKNSLDLGNSQTPKLNEVIIKSNGTVIESRGLLSLLLPGVNLADIFDLDPTSFVYVKSDGSWPGFVFKIKPELTASQAQNEFAISFESNTEIRNFYLDDPGNPSGTWRSGNTSGVSNRYTSFSKPGNSLNYGWVNGFLLISTSYDGFKEGVRRLQ